MDKPILSILICHLYKRAGALASLLGNLQSQIDRLGVSYKVEILIKSDDGHLKSGISTGAKRNHLLLQAKGEWVCFIDDDDSISHDYVQSILIALEENPDVVGFEGHMTTDGKNPIHFKISKEHPYMAKNVDGKQIYLRFNNHLSVIRRSIATEIMFKDSTYGEDHDFALRMKKSGLIQTEAYIPKEIYFYNYRTNKM